MRLGDIFTSPRCFGAAIRANDLSPSGCARRRAYPKVQGAVVRSPLRSVIPVTEPADPTVREFVGRPVAEPGGRRVNDRALQRYDYQLWRPAFRFGGSHVIQYCMTKVLVVTGRLGERQCEELSEIVSSTGRELQVRLREI